MKLKTQGTILECVKCTTYFEEFTDSNFLCCVGSSMQECSYMFSLVCLSSILKERGGSHTFGLRLYQLFRKLVRFVMHSYLKNRAIIFILCKHR